MSWTTNWKEKKKPRHSPGNLFGWFYLNGPFHFCFCFFLCILYSKCWSASSTNTLQCSQNHNSVIQSIYASMVCSLYTNRFTEYIMKKKVRKSHTLQILYKYRHVNGKVKTHVITGHGQWHPQKVERTRKRGGERKRDRDREEFSHSKWMYYKQCYLK